ncbi:hypothetical protein AB0L40_19795, partial [Patulibacter sp. NPDC049589]|uniref:hypothetical protein n=1 Tax=Patulibacter sp. NPDC049589 TaxID=3154731 RepID=UPI003433BFC5
AVQLADRRDVALADGVGADALDPLADAATARRLRVRTGTVLARVSAGARRAGDVRLRLKVTSALRTKVRKATRLTGTLRVRTTSATGPATATKRVTIRR